jgi:hypothetical protein
MEYARKRDRKRHTALDELTGQVEKTGLYDRWQRD